MEKYTYKNKITGAKIYTNCQITGEEWELVSEIKDGMMKSEDKNVVKKDER